MKLDIYVTLYSEIKDLGKNQWVILIIGTGFLFLGFENVWKLGMIAQFCESTKKHELHILKG